MFSCRLPGFHSYDLIITGLGWELTVNRTDVLWGSIFLVFTYPITK